MVRLDSLEFMERCGREIGLPTVRTGDRRNVSNEELPRTSTVGPGDPLDAGAFFPAEAADELVSSHGSRPESGQLKLLVQDARLALERMIEIVEGAK
jgi:hypothetical protein